MKAWLKSVQERMRRKYKQRAWPVLYRSFSRKESRKWDGNLEEDVVESKKVCGFSLLLSYSRNITDGSGSPVLLYLKFQRHISKCIHLDIS